MSTIKLTQAEIGANAVIKLLLTKDALKCDFNIKKPATKNAMYALKHRINSQVAKFIQENPQLEFNSVNYTLDFISTEMQKDLFDLGYIKVLATVVHEPKYVLGDSDDS